jgi:hypothetical protein
VVLLVHVLVYPVDVLIDACVDRGEFRATASTVRGDAVDKESIALLVCHRSARIAWEGKFMRIIKRVFAITLLTLAGVAEYFRVVSADLRRDWKGC